jgi:hypothetical protein
MHTLPAPRSNAELRAPKNCRHPRRPRCSGSQSTKHPFLRDLSWGKWGGSIRGSTSLSSDGSQPESCSGCLDPRDGSTSSIASHRLAPRAKRKSGRSCHVPYPKQFTTLVRICRSLCKKNSKRIRTELAECSLGTSELQHPLSMQKLPTQKTSILAGS